MRTWAHWTAKTVMLTATFAAAPRTGAVALKMAGRRIGGNRP